MNHSISYPTWLLRERELINDILQSQMRLGFRSDPLATEFKRCLLAGRKIRTILFRVARCTHESRGTLEMDASVAYAIECAHAASVLVDDILDLDRLRHGYDATQTVWGAGRSALASHVLLGSALSALADYSALQKRFITAYEDASWGELHDVMWVPGAWMREGYSSIVYEKTSALFSFALDAAGYMNTGYFGGVLEQLGSAFGRLYQIANDYFDWQPELLLERHESDQSWPVTFSLPLATHLALFGDSALGDFRNKTLSYSEWLAFLRIVWHPDVVSTCQRLLRDSHQEVTSLIQRSGLGTEGQSKLRHIADLATTREFWFHELKVA